MGLKQQKLRRLNQNGFYLTWISGPAVSTVAPAQRNESKMDAHLAPRQSPAPFNEMLAFSLLVRGTFYTLSVASVVSWTQPYLCSESCIASLRVLSYSIT